MVYVLTEISFTNFRLFNDHYYRLFIKRYKINYFIDNVLTMPKELSIIIQDYARPLSRPNWRQGGSFNSELFIIGSLVIYNKLNNIIKHQIIKSTFARLKIKSFLYKLEAYEININF